VLFHGGGESSQEAYLGVRSGDAGRTWKRLLAEAYFGTKAPFTIDSYSGPWTIVGEKSAYFVGWCPACGRLAATGGKCPLDGTSLEDRENGLDLLVHQTLVHGGAVWVVQHVQDLAPADGIGALLRF